MSPQLDHPKGHFLFGVRPCAKCCSEALNTQAQCLPAQVTTEMWRPGSRGGVMGTGIDRPDLWPSEQTLHMPLTWHPPLRGHGVAERAPWKGLWALVVQMTVLVGWNKQDAFRNGFFSHNFWILNDFFKLPSLSQPLPPAPPPGPATVAAPRAGNRRWPCQSPQPPAGFFLPATGVIRHEAKGRKPLWAELAAPRVVLVLENTKSPLLLPHQNTQPVAQRGRQTRQLSTVGVAPAVGAPALSIQRERLLTPHCPPQTAFPPSASTVAQIAPLEKLKER